MQFFMSHRCHIFVIFCMGGCGYALDRPVSLNGIIGNIPYKLSWLSDQFRQATLENKALLPYKNRLIIYGPPGNGKSTLARMFAQLTGSKLYELDGPSVVRRYVGQGVENIESLFEEALQYCQAERQKVVIFIDEVDAIANNSGDTNYRSEHIAALQKLWIYLDKCKENPYVFFVCATNHFDELDKIFLDRFGANVIEITNPDAQLRHKVISYYFEKQQLFISASLLHELVKLTADFSIRSLEDLASDVCLAKHFSTESVDVLTRQAIRDIKIKMKKNANKNSKESLLQQINTVLSSIYFVMVIAQAARTLLML